MIEEKIGCQRERRIRHRISENAYIKIIKNIIFSLVSASPADGGSAELCEAIGASLNAQVKIVLSALLTLIPRFLASAHTYPFRRLRRHLPRVRGRHTVSILPFFHKNQVKILRKRNSLMPSFLSGGN